MDNMVADLRSSSCTVPDREPPPFRKYKSLHFHHLVTPNCGSIRQLEENVQLAREFTPLSAHQMTSLASRAEPVSKQAMFFKFVTRS
jgi:hypothetical protein